MSSIKHLIISIAAVTVLMGACHRPYYIEQRYDSFYTVKGTEHTDSSFIKMLAPYKEKMEGQMQVIIGHTDTTLTKMQPECTLGNFLADAQLKAAIKTGSGAVAAVANYGGIRIPYIKEGAIRLENMYEMMPFDNVVVIAEIPGNVMKRFCDHIARAKGWPVSGIKFDMVGKEARRIYINSQPLDEHATYKIAINDYMASGGDECDFLVPLKKETTNIFVRDALISYVKELEKEGKPLHPKLENRLQYGD